MKNFVFLFLLLFATNILAQCNKCDSLEDALKNPKTVKTLVVNPNLNNEIVEKIPISIGDLVNLKILYLTDQPIEMVPKEIGKLKNLKELSFAGCQLTELPEEVFQLRNLKELILFDNNFSDDYKKRIKKWVTEKMPHTKLRID